MFRENFGENTLSSYTKTENLGKCVDISGKGAYGTVYKAIENKTKCNVAIKKIINEMDGEGFPSTSIREISLLREVQHPKVIKYKII